MAGDAVFMPAIPSGAPVAVVLIEQPGCPACEEYHPIFVEAAAAFARQGLPIVRVDAGSEDPATQAFMNAYNVESTPTVIAAALYRGKLDMLEGVSTPIETRRLLEVAWAHNRRRLL